MKAPWVDEANAAFARIYDLDLVYRPNCWKLCGDAHCCSFTRYKSRFVFLGNKPFQELLLLPGEWDYLVARGATEQFGDHEHKQYAFPIGERFIRADTLLSRKPHCACEHDTRTTVCRLYPVLPVFDIEGHLVGTEPFGIFEELEQLEGMPRACQIDAVPLGQLDLLLTLVAEIGRIPLFVFYASAYQLAKAQVRTRLAATKRDKPAQSAFSHFENAFFRQQLLDDAALGVELEALRQRFSARYGAAFDRALDSMIVPAPEPRRPLPRAARAR